MPIKDIKDKILENAIQEREDILKKANEEIKKIRKTAENELKEIKDKITLTYEQEAEIKENEIITEAKLNANKEILSEKQSIIEELFKETEKRIKKLDKQQYKKFIERLILENIESGNETIYISDNDREIINQDFIDNINKKLKENNKNGELKISEKSIPIRGGVVLGTDEVKKNASLEIILEKIKENMETQLNQFLFQKKEE